MMNQMNPEALAAELAKNPGYRVLRKLDAASLFELDAVTTDKPAIGIILDVETTGRDASADKIIELGMVSFAYDPLTGAILSALETFNQLEDPGMPIPEEASRVNGITDEMVQGQRIDDEKVAQMVADADLVIAHNASFDRVFCEARFPHFRNKAWACSLQQVGWESAGIRSGKLDYIAFCLGFFHDAHRAENDCLALLKALNTPMASLEGKRAFEELLDNYQKELRRIWAVNSPYGAKDLLKSRGYRWSDGVREDSEKAWWIEVPVEDFDAEMEWLHKNAFNGKAFSVPVDAVNAFNRFSDRRLSLERAYRG